MYIPYVPKTPMWPAPVYNEAGKCTHVYGVPVAELRRVLAMIDDSESTLVNPWGQPETGFMRMQRMWRKAEDRLSMYRQCGKEKQA